ncbi:27681_t:CDS:2, partial [Gigaspora margarita]
MENYDDGLENIISLGSFDFPQDRNNWQSKVQQVLSNKGGVTSKGAARLNVYCDQCEKYIGNESLAYFSDAEKDLDFCSEDLKELNISKKNLEGELTLNDFTNLESLDCSHNRLTSLDLNISNNNLSLQELVVFSQFINLIGLHVGNSSPENINKGVYNRFSGSLAPLQDLNKLYSLNISNTDLNNGIEYLPESLSGFNKAGEEKVLYSTKERSNCKLREIEPQLASIGLTVNDYEFADYLQREKNLSPQEAKEYLEGLRDEYEDCDFDAEQTKEELREEYKKHISEIANSSQFGKEVHNELRKRAKLILDNPNFDLKVKEYARELIKMQNEENEEYEDGVCSECYKPNTSYNWCRECNAEHFIQEFDKWTSGNPEVNAFIKQYQLKDALSDFLHEATNHKLFKVGHVTRCYGISQNPETKDYLMVINYMKGGNLRQYLASYYNRTNFSTKLSHLKNIARGLEQIHEQGLIHKDLHPASKICQGLRPSLDVKLPQSIKNLVTNYTETYYHEVLEAAKFNKELSSKRNSYHVHPQVSYFSRSISTQQISELAKKLQESEQVSSQLNEIAENIKKIEEKIKCFKKSLNSELAEPIDNFIQARKKMTQDKNDKQ